MHAVQKPGLLIVIFTDYLILWFIVSCCDEIAEFMLDIFQSMTKKNVSETWWTLRWSRSKAPNCPGGRNSWSYSIKCCSPLRRISRTTCTAAIRSNGRSWLGESPTGSAHSTMYGFFMADCCMAIHCEQTVFVTSDSSLLGIDFFRLSFQGQIHLIGNVAVWYAGTLCLAIYACLFIFYLLRRRRRCYDIDEG